MLSIAFIVDRIKAKVNFNHFLSIFNDPVKNFKTFQRFF